MPCSRAGWPARRCSRPTASPIWRSSGARRAPSCTASARAIRLRSCRTTGVFRYRSAPGRRGWVADASGPPRHASWRVFSGPAGGAVGAARMAELAGAGDAVGLDMGGTSCDVSLALGGGAAVSGGREVGGRALALPMVDVHTVGAGGGSIAWRDAGGALRVGPRSAGARPGPAAYGHGGSEPTVTDANLLLGLLSTDAPLAGGDALGPEKAARAVSALGHELGLTQQETAEGIVRVANAEMIRALRVMTVER